MYKMYTYIAHVIWYLGFQSSGNVDGYKVATQQIYVDGWRMSGSLLGYGFMSFQK